MESERYFFYFQSPEEATNAIDKINKILCENLSLCLSLSCGCEIENNKNTVCKSYVVESTVGRNTYVSEGPQWTTLYLQDGINLYVHFFNYSRYTELEMMKVKEELGKFQSQKATKLANNPVTP